ncbi:hypothetical protein ACHAWO_009686 [Cyclotella atomus]|uniref:AB hydrolase-1 domain-containing protein n=1 Tax=Cyclotella atomus TaxID=382360 RepID=A0ABD3NNR3_9STRA
MLLLSSTKFISPTQAASAGLQLKSIRIQHLAFSQLPPSVRHRVTPHKFSHSLSFIHRDTGSTSHHQAAPSSDEEPRTGWLHNTEAPSYYQPQPNDSSLARKMLMVEMMKYYRNHRMVHPPAFHPCGKGQKMVVTEHKVTVPLTYPDLVAAKASGSEHKIITVDRIDSGFDSKESFDGPKLDVYFTITELVSSAADEEFFQSLMALSPKQRAERYTGRSPGVDPSRMMLYLQGGPGFGCASPVSGLSLDSPKSSWAAQVLLGGLTNVDGKSFQRAVLMDQRGTGKSTPINKQRLQKLFPDLFSLDCVAADDGSPSMQLTRAKFDKALSDATEYMASFRADSIVRDAEWIKDNLIGLTSGEGENISSLPWGAALGQSFGGFCLMTYLSSITRPPKICLFTGGLAPMNTPVREVYDRLWLRVRERNLRYYEQYPGDVAVVKKIVRKLLADEAKMKMPSGGILTARRFLQLGLALGGTPGVSFASLHTLVNAAFVDDESDELSHAFIKQVEAHQSFDDAPLYFLLHESIYADGPGATDWAAHSSFESISTSTVKEFDYNESVNTEDSPTLFFGEMVFPWMAEGDFAEVSGHGMRSLSKSLATKQDWLPLFDAANMRKALLSGGALAKTKSAAAVYFEDMYVDFDCSMKLVQRNAPLEGVKVWVTNDYQHSGLRDDGATIVNKLLGMAKGCIRVPS